MKENFQNLIASFCKNDPRDEPVFKLFKQRHATSAEIFGAVFGSSTFRGLPVETPCSSEPVRFASYLEDNQNGIVDKILNTAFSGGYVSGNKQRNIYINHPPYYLPKHPLFYLLSVYAHFIAKQPDRMSLAHEHMHVLQGEKGGANRSSSLAYNFFRDTRIPFDQLSLLNKAEYLLFIDPHRTYVQSGEEIQAMLHEIIADGYLRWNKLPTTKHELWAALVNQGLPVPQKIAKEITETTEGKEAQKLFGIPNQQKKLKKKFFHMAARSTMSADGEEAFWRDLIPQIYAETLELYGIKNGRQRMKLSPLSPKPV